MDIGTLRGLLTATLLILFLAVWAWTWSRKRKDTFERMAEMPLEDDSKPPPVDTRKEQSP
ncbi:MAG: cbb3-type cytochrome c oxidase subunit 3 [Woeseia sp.]